MTASPPTPIVVLRPLVGEKPVNAGQSGIDICANQLNVPRRGTYALTWHYGETGARQISCPSTRTNLLAEFWKMAFAATSLRYAVLIVEDEPLLRMSAAAIVEEAGFMAIQAKSADEAVEILESRTDIRIVFTDIEMPGSMDGLKLALAVRNRWPPIELILTSGKRMLRDEELPARGRFFAKPYDTDELIQAMRSFAP
ncbi:MAG: response regulator [Dongiaceae bacterium]